MEFNKYQTLTAKTAVYSGHQEERDLNKISGLIYTTLGLAGEAGEIANKVKKVIRDDNCILSEATKQKIADEVGDVAWYMSQLTTELNKALDDIAAANIAKLMSRLERGTIQGSGDNR